MKTQYLNLVAQFIEHIKMTKTNKNLSLLLITVISLFFLSISFIFAQTTELPESADKSESIIRSLPDPVSPPLSPCPGPEREPRFVYREKVVHEERQFRAKHTGCGGDIMMRQWQVVGLEIGRCDGGPNEECNDPEWMDEFVYYYDRYTPNQDGEIFDEVGSWQKAWPSSGQWLTEEEMLEKYGEPIPFPTCQTDCLQAPPGVPGQVGQFSQEDPYYFNNPWLPEMIGGERPQSITQLREKNILGGENPLDRVQLPVKLFWWNIPGWQDGWIEDGEIKECEGPEDIACVDSYIIRFDNINREDRPAKFHRHEVVNRLIEEDGESYRDAQRKFEDLEVQNRRAYERYRVEHDDRRSLDVMRYDRDNIIGCDNCGTEKEIWLNTNTFNPLDFDPKYDYDREKRKWMKNWLLNEFDGSDEGVLRDIITEVYGSYGRPALFRSGVEHSYSLQATCAPHDYLEKEEGWRGPEATFSFETSDAPELISPIDPNWTSPYDAKRYDPEFNPTRIRAEKIGEDEDENPIYYPSEDYKNGYRYPAETSQAVGDTTTALRIDGPLSDFLEDPTNPFNVNGRQRAATDGERGPSKNSPEADRYQEYIAETANYVDMELAGKIVHAGGTAVIPPEKYWQNIIPTAEVVGLVEEQVGTVNVTSTYRPLGYNRQIGSSDGSQHVQNTAIDFWSPNASTRQIYNLTQQLRDEENMFTGGIGIYPSSGFVHVDTRGYDADWGGEYASADTSSSMEAGEQSFLREEVGLGAWWNNLSDKHSIWDEDSYSLVFQDQVSLREELEWAQQWYQPNPSRRPEPPRVYLMSFGDGVLVTQENIGEYGEPVLEDCHEQLKETSEELPFCSYDERPVGTHEAQHRYPEPNHLDREMEFFTLPEDSREDIYSWNIASCRDRATTDCTDFSQMWRFQLDERETQRLYPPRNITPQNYRNQGVTIDNATTGFPFRIRWDRRFGARSYVYRLRKEGEDDWSHIEIQRERDDYFSTGVLNFDYTYGASTLINWTGDLKLDTKYEWDVKACWDDNISHEIDEDESDYVKEVADWVKENKQCSSWRSEDAHYADAPFKFKTAGRPPNTWEVNSPLGESVAYYPIDFDWRDIPGAESYAIIIEKNEADLGFDPTDWDSGATLPSPSTHNILMSEADRGALVPSSGFRFVSELELGQMYNYQIFSCVNPVENSKIYWQKVDETTDYFDYEFTVLPTLEDDMHADMMQAGCNPLAAGSEVMSFVPSLAQPKNLTPGNEDLEEAERIIIDDSIQTLSWDKVPGAEAYLVNIEMESAEEVGLVKRVYANEDKEGEIITENNEITYDFERGGLYSWTVTPCITDDCKSQTGGHESVRGEESDRSYVEIYTPSFLGFGGVVPCGRNHDIFQDNPDLDSRDDCEFIHIFVMIGRIIEEVLVKILVPYSLVLLLIYTGYLYYTGLGDPKTMQQVFKVWEYALKGYLLIFLSWFIVGGFLTLVGYQFGAWWQITNL